MTISASEARSRLFPLIQQVNDDHAPVSVPSAVAQTPGGFCLV
jgi:antitoxin YefM